MPGDSSKKSADWFDFNRETLPFTIIAFAVGVACLLRVFVEPTSLIITKYSIIYGLFFIFIGTLFLWNQIAGWGNVSKSYPYNEEKWSLIKSQLNQEYKVINHGPAHIAMVKYSEKWSIIDPRLNENAYLFMRIKVKKAGSNMRIAFSIGPSKKNNVHLISEIKKRLDSALS